MDDVPWGRGDLMTRVTITSRYLREWMPQDDQVTVVENEDIVLAYAEAIGTMAGMSDFRTILRVTYETV